MYFEKYIFNKTIKHTKFEMPFGNFYCCDKFIVSELHEGVHFDWKKLELVVEKTVEFYGKKRKLGFISNRINHYSVDPSIWTKGEKKYNLIEFSAIVIYNQGNLMNASIEKKFTNTPIKTFRSLQDAITYIVNLKELQF